MRLTPFLTHDQVETIHRNALRVLSEIGVRVEHEGVRERLAALGGQYDTLTDSVRFSPQTVETHVAKAPKYPIENTSPTIGAHSGIYQSYYLDPLTDELLPFNEERLARFAGFANSFPRIASVGMLGVPFVPEDIPAPYIPLAEKLYCWKYGLGIGGEIHFTGLCEPLLEMFECHASYQGKKVEDVFCGGGYLISPLKLARQECEQLLFFYEHGLRIFIGHLPMQGGTAPVSLAGSLVLSLAEQIFLFLLQRAFWSDAVFGLAGSISTVDMRTGVSCYGRPEMQRVNMAFADIARFYGCSCGGHTGLTDAKLPSYEAGAQKATGALITALATGHGSISAGLLGMDEICSPVQMVLDDELVGGLQALLAESVVDETECAFDEILAAGIGGNHLGTDFTARRFREELYHPRTWSGQFASGWIKSGKKTDVDMARDIAMQLERRFVPTSQIPDEEERDLRTIIERTIRLRQAGV